MGNFYGIRGKDFVFKAIFPNYSELSKASTSLVPGAFYLINYYWKSDSGIEVPNKDKPKAYNTNLVADNGINNHGSLWVYTSTQGLTKILTIDPQELINSNIIINTISGATLCGCSASNYNGVT